MSDEPQFTVRGSDPGAAKGLRLIAGNVRATNPARADEIDAHAAEMDRWASRKREGTGFTPKP